MVQGAWSYKVKSFTWRYYPRCTRIYKAVYYSRKCFLRVWPVYYLSR